MALAVVAGPVLAFLAFTLVFPTDRRRRQRRLKAMVLRELEAMIRRPGAGAGSGSGCRGYSTGS